MTWSGLTISTLASPWMSPAVISGGQRQRVGVARALAAELDHGLITPVQADGDVLEVEQHLQYIFLEPFHGGVLVQDAVDLGLDDGSTGNG